MPKFSTAEKSGIATMTGGIAFGLYHSVTGILKVSTSVEAFSEFLASDEIELKQISVALSEVTNNLAKGAEQTSLGHIGFWVFLFGVMIFLIARRAKWNKQRTPENSVKQELDPPSP